MTERNAVVLGGGLSGTLAAIVLSEHGYATTLVDRDHLPVEPLPRDGLPQGRHAHLLMSGGARALENLLPGVVADLIRAGANHLSVPDQVITSTHSGWGRRWPGTQYIIACSRDLLDWCVRSRLPARVKTVEHSLARWLTGDFRRVTGVTIENRRNGEKTTLEADVVIDATGRSSKATAWIEALGLPRVPETIVDPGIVYSTRLYQSPSGMERWPATHIVPSPYSTPAGKCGLLLPIEHNKWMVTVAGFRGAEPPFQVPGYLEFAKSLRDPILSELIELATPLTNPVGYSTTTNRRRHFDRMPNWPTGFAVVGDASSVFNPVYAQGLTCAIMAVRELRDGLDADADWHDIQGAITRSSSHAWSMAESQDVRYPNTSYPRGVPGPHQRIFGQRLATRYMDRLNRSINVSETCARAYNDVITLSRSPARLLAPRVLLSVLSGPGKGPQLALPPLTAGELKLLARRVT